MRSEKLPGAPIWPPVLACGAWLKNTACLLQGDQVLWSPLHGDLGDPQSCLDYARQVNPQIQIIQLSARDGTGLDAWLDWLLAGAPAVDRRAARIAELEAELARLKAQVEAPHA